MSVLNKKVLVLNQGFEAMGTIPVKKAMCKLENGSNNLEVLLWDKDAMINGAKSPWPVPSIMRLTYAISIRKRKAQSLSKRSRILLRDRFKCAYCGIKPGKVHPVTKVRVTQEYLTLDHIHPKSKGGTTSPDNLVTACKPCNSRKDNRTPEEAKMPLLVSKTLLKASLDRISLMSLANTNPQWKQYLYMCDGDGDDRYSHKEG
jgi:5-methylcytosine-specific restriction endonuclease McrA